MFGQVLDKLDTWFGRTFLLARFVPCLVAVTLNALITYVAFPGVRAWMTTTFGDLASTGMVGYLILLLGGIGVFAYALAPVGRIGTQLLEGAWLLQSPLLKQFIGEPLVHRQSLRLDAFEHERQQLRRGRAGLLKRRDDREFLSNERRKGVARRQISSVPAIDQAEQRITMLRECRHLRRQISAKELDQAAETVAQALRLNCAERSQLPPGDADARSQAERLSKLHVEFVSTIVPYATLIAQDREGRLNQQIDQSFARAELLPTPFGNLAAAMRSYCKTRYGIEFDYFWSRFLLAIQKNDKLSAPIVAAKIQLDFAVMSLLLTTASVAGWALFFLLQISAHGFVPVFFCLAFGPGIVGVWLGVAEANYKDFAETTRGAIDIARFDLLTALHQPLPATVEAERRIWDRLARLSLLDEVSADIPLRHPST